MLTAPEGIQANWKRISQTAGDKKPKITKKVKGAGEGEKGLVGGGPYIAKCHDRRAGGTLLL